MSKFGFVSELLIFSKDSKVVSVFTQNCNFASYNHCIVDNLVSKSCICQLQPHDSSIKIDVSASYNLRTLE